MAGENVKNFFEQPGKDGDNKFIMKGSSATGSGVSLKTIMLHGRIPDATSTDGTLEKTDAIPIPFNGTIISIQAALRKFPQGSQIILLSNIDSEAITDGEITFNAGTGPRTKEVFPTDNNTVVAGDNFNITFGQSNTNPQSVTSLAQEQISGVNTGIAKAQVASHGFATGDIVEILGANESGFNGFHRITILDNTNFVFLVSPDVQTTASGTINALKSPIIPINYSVVIELD